MNIELKNIKYAAFASQETACYQATIYVDGVKSGTVENDGRGGCDFIHPSSLETRINEYAKTLPKRDLIDIGVAENDPFRFMDQTAESIFAGLLTDYLVKRDLKRMCSKKTLFRKAGETYKDGEYLVMNWKFDAKVKADIQAKYPGATILNETV